MAAASDSWSGLTVIYGIICHQGGIKKLPQKLPLYNTLVYFYIMANYL